MSAGGVGSSLQTVGTAIRTCFSLASNGLFTEALKQVGEVGKDLMYFVGFGFYVGEVYDVIKRDDLKKKQKILPLIGYGAATLVSLATGVAVCAAASLAIPPLMFAGSVANVVRNVGIYFKERAERNNLRKMFKEAEFQEGGNIRETIDKVGLSEHLSQDFSTFLKQKHFDANKIQELYVRLAYDFINKTKDDQEALSSLLRTPIEGLSSSQKHALREQIKEKEKALKDKFANEYKELFTLLEKKQRLHRLEKGLNGRLANIFISAGVSLVSLLAMVVPMAIAATPAAPAAPLVYSILAGVSGGLGVVAALNAGRLAIQDQRSYQKAVAPKEKVSDAVFPSLEGNRRTQEMTERSQILYKRSWWQKTKDGLRTMWNRLWKSKPSSPTPIDKVEGGIDANEMVNLSSKEKTNSPSVITVQKPATPKPQPVPIPVTINERTQLPRKRGAEAIVPMRHRKRIATEKLEEIFRPQAVMAGVLKEMEKKASEGTSKSKGHGKHSKRSASIVLGYKKESDKENIPPLSPSVKKIAKHFDKKVEPGKTGGSGKPKR
ncbi:MAG: hypothetical protein BGO43_09375 [Gammaproteobacteria bacterium 39-13]|nr:hypothetical protein [Gammaproteobacteria bacterium]OJV93852.1 MAG: hypothetical protein BGO43_09375 [Gammaproteobacteria bacterium 39-13]